MKLVSLDLETTGLDPTRHEAWEIAVIDVGEPKSFLHFMMPVTMVGAEAKALGVGAFKERYRYDERGMAIQHNGPGVSRQLPVGTVVDQLHEFVKDSRLMGCSVHFDAAFLSELFRKHGMDPIAPWHHRHLDLGSYVAGREESQEPWGSSSMQSEILPNNNPHTAFGDARWNVYLWKQVSGI